MTPEELRVRAARLVDALGEADATAIRAALHGLNPGKPTPSAGQPPPPRAAVSGSDE